MKDDTSIDDAKIIEIMSTISKTIRCEMIKRSQTLGFTPSQILVVKYIMDKKITTLTDVAKHIGLSNSTICGIIDRLVKHGAIVKERSNEDRRVVFLKPSLETEKRKEELVNTRNKLISNWFAKINPVEKKEIITALEKVNTLLNYLASSD